MILAKKGQSLHNASMKTTVTAEHFLFYQEHNLIEFENLLTPEEIEKLNHEIDKELSKRMKVTDEILDRQSPQLLFDAGHDLWRSNPVIAKFARKSRLAGIAAELFKDRPLRLGYDQFFPALSPEESTTYLQDHPYTSLLKTTPHLTGVSSIQGIQGGLMLCLKGTKHESTALEEKEPEDITIFSDRTGSGVFFKGNEPIPFNLLNQRDANRYFLIVYTHRTSVYIINQRDPHKHILRELGYEVGDRLSDELHPIVCR